LLSQTQILEVVVVVLEPLALPARLVQLAHLDLLDL